MVQRPGAWFQPELRGCRASRSRSSRWPRWAVFVGESDAAVQLRIAGQAQLQPGPADQDEPELMPVVQVSDLFQASGLEPVGLVDDDQLDVREGPGRCGRQRTPGICRIAVSTCSHQPASWPLISRAVTDAGAVQNTVRAVSSPAGGTRNVKRSGAGRCSREMRADRVLPTRGGP